MNRQQYNSVSSDRGLTSVSLVLHGNSSIEDSKQIFETGFRLQEGRPTVSTDLAHATRWATSSEKRHYSKSTTLRDNNEVGAIFVVRVPKDIHVGYGIFTSMHVDDARKEVGGAPIKFASGRKQLALYEGSNTELLRQKRELDKQQNIIALPSEAIVAVIRPTTKLGGALDTFEAQVRNFDVPQTAQLVAVLTQACPTLSDEVIAELIRTTTESIVISRVRNIYLNAKRALGYKIVLEDKLIDKKKVELTDFTTEFKAIYRKVQSQDFYLSSGWLTAYIQEQLNSILAELSA